MNSVNFIEQPYAKCPYTFGEVKFIDNPCPNCKLNNYAMYYVLKKEKHIHKHSMK